MRSGAGGHVGGEDASSGGGPGSGEPGRSAWWCASPGGDLDVTQVDAGIEHGGDERVAQHVGMGPGYLKWRKHEIPRGNFASAHQPGAGQPQAA